MEVTTAGASVRTPPHNIDAEEGLLGAVLIDTASEVMLGCTEAKLASDFFFKPAHRIIYQAMQDMYDRGDAIEEVGLADYLRKRKPEGEEKSDLDRIGGYATLEHLASRLETTAHASYWREIVKEKFFLRETIRVCTDLVDRSYDQAGDIDNFLDIAEKRIFEISQTRVKDSARSINETVDAASKIIEFYAQQKGEISGVGTGLKDLDAMTFGLQKQEMIVLAARPSMGKTSLALNVAEAAALPNGGRKPVPTLVFSLEMSAEQLALRLLCSRAKVNLKRVKDGFLDREKAQEIAQAGREFKQSPLWIDDSGFTRILDLRAKARRIHSQHKLGLVIIDYLQLINGMDPRVPREQQISEISRGIKALAKELNVPVLVLSQLNRASDKERREPRLSDLRESGAIEQDADVVLLLAPKQDSEGADGATPHALPERNLIVAKNRNGPVGTVPLTFMPEYTRFENDTKEKF